MSLVFWQFLTLEKPQNNPKSFFPQLFNLFLTRTISRYHILNFQKNEPSFLWKLIGKLILGLFWQFLALKKPKNNTKSFFHEPFNFFLTRTMSNFFLVRIISRYSIINFRETNNFCCENWLGKLILGFFDHEKPQNNPKSFFLKLITFCPHPYCISL